MKLRQACRTAGLIAILASLVILLRSDGTLQVEGLCNEFRTGMGAALGVIGGVLVAGSVLCAAASGPKRPCDWGE